MPGIIVSKNRIARALDKLLVEIENMPVETKTSRMFQDRVTLYNKLNKLLKLSETYFYLEYEYVELLHGFLEEND